MEISEDQREGTALGLLLSAQSSIAAAIQVLTAPMPEDIPVPAHEHIPMRVETMAGQPVVMCKLCGAPIEEQEEATA